MNAGKIEMLVLILVLAGGKSHGNKLHKMEVADNQEKEEPCGDATDCLENQNLFTAKHLHGDQEETGGAYRRLREGLNVNFDENPVDQEAATHYLNSNESYDGYKEACLSDDEDCDYYDNDDDDDDDDDDYGDVVDDDDDDRKHQSGNENSNHRNSQPTTVDVIPDNKDEYIYF